MLRGGTIFAFDLAALELKETAEVVEKPKPAPARPRPALIRRPQDPKPIEKKDGGGGGGGEGGEF